jgi:hypothetical protein
MCLIVDNDVVHRVLLKPDDEDFKHVHSSLFGLKKPKAVLVYGGSKLNKEYTGSEAIIEKLLELRRAGRARREDDGLVDSEEKRVAASKLCSSNDEHIIALALVSKARLLCSRDNALAGDFTNKALIDKPRGKVYKYATHKKLLMQFCQ